MGAGGKEYLNSFESFDPKIIIENGSASREETSRNQKCEETGVRGNGRARKPACEETGVRGNRNVRNSNGRVGQ